jgi:LemA protein
MEWLNWIIGIVAAVVAIAVIGVCAMRSRFTSLSYACEDAYAVVDRFLKKRYDLIPAFIDVIQEHAAHETGVIENLIAYRNASIKAASLMEKCELESQLADTFRELLAMADKYQALRVSAVFMTLKHDLRAVELDIANAGEQYNRRAKQYNAYYDQAISNIVATLFQRKKMAEFVIRQTGIEE